MRGRSFRPGLVNAGSSKVQDASFERYLFSFGKGEPEEEVKSGRPRPCNGQCPGRRIDIHKKPLSIWRETTSGELGLKL